MTSLSSAPTGSLNASPEVSTWELDPAHSHVEFAVRHLMISTVKGASPTCRARSGDSHE
jgi:polyisoprenoid-binding protein YceI